MCANTFLVLFRYHINASNPLEVALSTQTVAFFAHMAGAGNPGASWPVYNSTAQTVSTRHSPHHISTHHMPLHSTPDTTRSTHYIPHTPHTVDHRLHTMYSTRHPPGGMSHHVMGRIQRLCVANSAHDERSTVLVMSTTLVSFTVLHALITGHDLWGRFCLQACAAQAG